MNERNHIKSLTRMALLNAIILSFLSFQFVAPIAFIALLWIIPIIFALGSYYAPLKLTLLSGLLIILFSFVLFGIDVGFWAIGYVFVGSVLGNVQKIHSHWTIRFLSVAFALSVAILAIMTSFAWFAQISWHDIQNISTQLNLTHLLPIVPVVSIGLVVWSASLSMAINWFFSRVLRQLQIEA